MPTSLSLPRISTNVRFAASALLFPELAGAWAERLFLTPPRNGGAAAALDLIEARSSLFEHKGRHIATWRWGARDAPAVILAHGVSEGRLTGLPDFADLLTDLAWHHGEARAFIGHSLGGAAGALALATGRVRFEKVVLVSPPADLVGYSRRFARWYWMPEAVRRAMQSAIEERYGVLWENLEVARLAPRLRAQALVIHDRDDRHVP